MPKSVNKVILVGNVGKKTLRSGLHRAALRSLTSASLPTKGSKTQTKSGRIGPSGTASWRGNAWRRSLGNPSP
jgi:hypothetical protein